MAVEIGRRPLPALAVHPSFVRRVYGFGSVFGKTLRDSRWSILIVAAVLGIIILAGGATMAGTYGTPETRRELADMAATLPPVMRGFYGNPVRVDTLGGFISWHYGAYFALLAGLWSILALSSTLALEAKRGSLDFAVSTPMSRRKIALEKLGGHLVSVVIASTVIGVLAWVTGAFFGRLDGDSIAPDAALGFALGLGLKALIAGAVAFAMAPVLGRGAAAGLAGALMVAGYILNSYRTAIPAFEGPSNVLWFAWTRDFLPLAGQWDWPGLGLVALVTVVLLAIGVEAFARRDIGVTVAVRTPGMPRVLLGVGGPLARSFGETLPSAIWWGVGLGLLSFVMSASSTAFVDELNRSPGLTQAVRDMVPGIDMTTSAGFLQMVFIDLGLALVGLAAATFVAGWASDETSRSLRAPPHDAPHPSTLADRERPRRVRRHRRHSRARRCRARRRRRLDRRGSGGARGRPARAHRVWRRDGRHRLRGGRPHATVIRGSDRGRDRDRDRSPAGAGTRAAPAGLGQAARAERPHGPSARGVVGSGGDRRVRCAGNRRPGRRGVGPASAGRRLMPGG